MKSLLLKGLLGRGLMVAVIMVIGTGCKEENKAKPLGEQLESSLRKCGLLSDGEVNLAMETDIDNDCVSDCLINADCAAYNQLYCQEPSGWPKSLVTCLQKCDFEQMPELQGEWVECASDGTLVPAASACDGWGDCADGSDEQDCENFVDGQFVCDDGSRTDAYNYCDFDVDCPDGSDEVGCPWEAYGTFECADGSEEIPQSFVCDQYPDCDDASDEKDCGYEVIECADGSWTITDQDLCDGYFDCDDGSDEQDCDYETFVCANGSETIAEFRVCNLWEDCEDGSDEWECAKLTCGE